MEVEVEGADFAGKEVVVVFPVMYYFECCRMILGGSMDSFAVWDDWLVNYGPCISGRCVAITKD